MIEIQTLFNLHLELFYSFFTFCSIIYLIAKILYKFFLDFLQMIFEINHYKSYGFSNLSLVNLASAVMALAMGHGSVGHSLGGLWPR